MRENDILKEDGDRFRVKARNEGDVTLRQAQGERCKKKSKFI